MPYVPLVDITVSLIGGWFAVTAVRRTPMVVDTGVLRYHGGEGALVNVSGGEVSVPEVTLFVGVIKLKAQRFGKSVIYPIL